EPGPAGARTRGTPASACGPGTGRTVAPRPDPARRTGAAPAGAGVGRPPPARPSAGKPAPTRTGLQVERAELIHADHPPARGDLPGSGLVIQRQDAGHRDRELG